MPMRRAVHALYECCYSVPLAADVARGRPLRGLTTQLFRQADTVAVRARARIPSTSILQAYPDVGRRPGQREVTGRTVRDLVTNSPEVMDQLGVASKRYLDHFGVGFVMFVNGYNAQDVSPR